MPEPRPDAALLIIGHGASTNTESGAPTRAHAATLAARGLFARVSVAFWKEPPSIREALAAIPEREIYVVPNFISEGYYTRSVIPRELGIAHGLPASHTLPDGRRLHYCLPAGSHPLMTRLLLHRAGTIAPGVAPTGVSLIIVGHGTLRNKNSAVAAREQAEAIAARGLYHSVAPAYMDEAPRIADWREIAPADTVVVVPFFIADGLHSHTDIPHLLGLPPMPPGEERAVFQRNPYALEGKRLYYAGAVGTDPLFAGVILDQVARFQPLLQP